MIIAINWVLDTQNNSGDAWQQRKLDNKSKRGLHCLIRNWDYWFISGIEVGWFYCSNVYTEIFPFTILSSFLSLHGNVTSNDIQMHFWIEFKTWDFHQHDERAQKSQIKFIVFKYQVQSVASHVLSARPTKSNWGSETMIPACWAQTVNTDVGAGHTTPVSSVECWKTQLLPEMLSSWPPADMIHGL